MTPVVLALGSNLGNRKYYLHAAIASLRCVVRVSRVSSVHETAPVECPPDSPPFLNLVLAGSTMLTADQLLDALQEIEAKLGRRRSVRNAARTIDVDIVLYGARVRRSSRLTLPHPRYLEREFVLAPLRELGLPWRDPVTQRALW